VASFFLQEPLTLLPPSVLLPPSSDPPETPTTPTPIVSPPCIMAAALNWASDSSDTMVISTWSPAPKCPHSPDQASVTSSSDMDTDMEQNTLPFSNLAPVPDRDNHDDEITYAKFFEDSQEPTSKLSTQQKRHRTMPSSLSLPEVLSPPSPSPDQQTDTMPSVAQQPEEAQEIQAVTLAFTQASCDNSQKDTETAPDVSNDSSPHSHDTASSVRDHSAMDSIFTMLNSLFQEPWTMLYEEALHEYMEDMPCSILGALELVTTWHQIHLGLLTMICTLEHTAGDCLQTSNPHVLAFLHCACPASHLCIILNRYV